MNKKRTVTIVDIAEAAAVSIATVSNVLNRRNVPMADETIRKVEKAAEELGYRRNAVAANLSRRKSNELGLIVPGFIGYYGRLAEEMERTAHQQRYHLSVFSAGGFDSEVEKRHLDALLQRRVDGLFCHGLAMSPDTTRKIVGEGTPLVLFNGWNWPQDIAVGAVNLDFAGGCVEMVKHLYDQGCRSLFYLSSGRAHAVNEQRVIGFKKGLIELAAPVISEVIELGLHDVQSIVSMTQEISGGLGPIGILAFDDLVALRFMSAVMEQGYHVPKDYKIAGINNDSVSSSCYPQLTTLDIPYNQQARLMIDLMLRQLGEPIDAGDIDVESGSLQPKPDEHELKIPLTLIPRMSTSQ
ncbi:LacI family DNA-binding transcriptional regulator [Paenibacillus radicis (ex Xue et al. 2023)]|uniref:LacI family transcriptional regulator n=1 Tax=Paenibacillus radicis (ex Xue et al. 2023) TaxID=2972489 RepID=A0ABT1Y9K2_9BACL|nr:LacI family DNA-binding transcriptional regulator [Paenibacillus radicis (ex Xue et al. 2023)]MCR8629857.1 LacI family transcriptional regulator [Paenibacillus radicis (ex Xue et al. 2023)]